jgi:RNA-directed DNA polymerase
VVDLDVERFFDRVVHEVLMSRVKQRIADPRALKLIDRYLKSGVMIGTMLEPTEEGVPQGGPLSPLLANLLLDDLDRELEKRGHRFVRYADDVQI